MLILSLVVYFHNPLVQLEVRYGFRSEAVMKIHPEKDPELAFDYDIYISGIDERLYIDLYYINDSDNRDRFVFPSAFQSDLENACMKTAEKFRMKAEDPGLLTGCVKVQLIRALRLADRCTLTEEEMTQGGHAPDPEDVLKSVMLT